MTLTVTLPFDGHSRIFQVGVVLDINALVLGGYEGVNPEHEAFCDLRFADDALRIWGDGIANVSREDSEYYSRALSVTSIDVFGGLKLSEIEFSRSGIRSSIPLHSR